MSDDMELERGSGNIFRDLEMPNPELEYLRSMLAAQIITTLDKRKLCSEKPVRQPGSTIQNLLAFAAPSWMASQLTVCGRCSIFSARPWT